MDRAERLSGSTRTASLFADSNCDSKQCRRLCAHLPETLDWWRTERQPGDDDAGRAWPFVEHFRRSIGISKQAQAVSRSYRSSQLAFTPDAFIPLPLSGPVSLLPKDGLRRLA